MRVIQTGLGFLILLCFVATLHAATLPVETFFRTYQYRSVALSPNGEYLAALCPDKQWAGLAVIDLKNLKASWAFAKRDADVAWFEWLNDERLMFKLSQKGYGVPGLFAVNRDGKKPLPLVQLGDMRTSVLCSLPDSTNDILVTSFVGSQRDFETGLFFPNVERMNIYTRSMTREVTNPGRVVSWTTDHQGVVRVGVRVEGNEFEVLYRDSKNAPWRAISRFGIDDDRESTPIGFEYDNRTLLVQHAGDNSMLGLYTFDLEQNQVKTLAFGHREADLEKVIFSDHKKRVVGVTFETDRPEVFYFDPGHKALQEKLDQALPGMLNRIISHSKDERKLVVLARSDRTPGCTYLLDATTMKLEKLFELADWIHPEEMAEMKPISYTSRDGLTIHGYLTLPLGSNGKNLPLVVNPHGGPTARDHWGFDPEVQFLANRGYAVLQVNFRGSLGYGNQFLRAGFKEWGLKQQDDITDGVRWAINQGIADPKRIAILGVSYGGFAALAGLERTPELYRCGVSIAGVTDVLRALRTHEQKSLDMLKLVLATTVGDRKTEKEKLKSISPINGVDQIRVPVLLAHGAQDATVPVADSRSMAKSLKSRNLLFDYIEKEDEGHGFHREENQIELWKRIDEFLQANMN